MANKRPAFQFYPGDWLKDPELSSCSAMTRGIWIDLLCRMFDSVTPGSVTGTIAQLARMARCSESEMEAALDELEETRASRVTRRGAKVTVASRRLEREAAERKSHADRQKRYRNNSDGESDGRCDAKVTSYSSSSSSTSVDEDKSSSIPTDPAEAVQAAWNSLGCVPKSLVLNEPRRKAIRARLADRWWRENWMNAISRIPSAAFLLGDNDTGWKAGFDWFIKPGSAAGILEGKYDRGRSSTNSVPLARGRPTVAEHNDPAFREVFGDEDHDDGNETSRETCATPPRLL